MLARHGLAPSKARGQNFLRNPATAQRLVEAVGLSPEDAAIEIGPGLGQLTRPIAALARRTLALELDRGLVRVLQEGGLPDGVELRHADAMQADYPALVRELGAPVVLFGNLPYRIAGRLLARVCTPDHTFRRMGLMIQAEMADRVLARPGTSAYGTLSVWARLWTQVHRALELSPEEFSPRPRVRSTFLVFEPLPEAPSVRDLEMLRELVRGVFQQRRKTLRSALRRRFPAIESALRSAEIDSGRRGETLSEHEFVQLADALSREEERA